jgi:hypothetical protein
MAKKSVTEKKKISVAKSKSPFSPGKGKTWGDKISSDKAPEVKVNHKGFADIPPGGVMLIATPKVIDDYVREIPQGKHVSLQTMRKDLAVEFKAEYSCPVVTGICLRIVAEAAYEAFEKGKSLKSITPFWRVVDEKSTIGKKLSFGSDFVKKQRKKEGLSE